MGKKERLPRKVKKRIKAARLLLTRQPLNIVKMANWAIKNKSLKYSRHEVKTMNIDLLIALLQLKDEDGLFSYGSYVSIGDPELSMNERQIRNYAVSILCENLCKIGIDTAAGSDKSKTIMFFEDEASEITPEQFEALKKRVSKTECKPIVHGIYDCPPGPSHAEIFEHIRKHR